MSAELITFLILSSLLGLGLWKINHKHICWSCGSDCKLVEVRKENGVTYYKYKCQYCGREFWVDNNGFTLLKY